MKTVFAFFLFGICFSINAFAEITGSCKYDPTYQYMIEGRTTNGSACNVKVSIRASHCDVFYDDPYFNYRREHHDENQIIAFEYTGDIWMYESHHQGLKDLVTLSEDPHFSRYKLVKLLSGYTVNRDKKTNEAIDSFVFGKFEKNSISVELYGNTKHGKTKSQSACYPTDQSMYQKLAPALISARQEYPASGTF